MSKVKPIEIDMKLEGNDVLRYFYKVTFGRSILSNILAGFGFFSLLLISLLIINEVLAGRGNTISGFAFLPLIALFLLIISLILIIYSVKKNAKRIRIIFADNEIDIYAPNQTSQIGWQNYRKIIETKKDFLLIGQGGNSFPIPKRFFQNDLQTKEFRELVREKLGDKAELKND